ncbi:MAG: ribosomal protein S18 acetylase RimI-like enzyme [Chlamydiales bacterium]|jgi:ribosomal protein S18 acetylase RimI-like enzyme
MSTPESTLDALLIRPFERRDRPALAEMAREVVEGGEEFVFEHVHEVLDYWLGKRTWTFVAEIDGVVAGTYALKPNYPGRGAHVANLGYMVAAKFRSRGVGHALGEHSLDAARAHGFRSVQFNMVVGANAAALRLWEKLGFERVGVLPGVFRHRERGLVDAYVMHRTL